MLENLAFARFRARFRLLESMSLPAYSGSALRGALGYAFRTVRYGTRDICPSCPCRPACRHENLSSYFFDAPADHPHIWPGHQLLPQRMRRDTYPPPFILEPVTGGDHDMGERLDLGFTLVGKALAHLPFFLCALRNAAARGLGRGRARLVLEAVTVQPEAPQNGGETAHHGETGVDLREPLESDFLSGIQTTNFTSFTTPGGNGGGPGDIPSLHTDTRRIHLRFHTPFRYKDGDRLGQPLTFPIFARNLFRRLTHLSVHSPLETRPDFAGLLAAAAEVEVESNHLRWVDIERYSTRQKEWMAFGGFIGEVLFRGELVPFLPFIRLGECLNVGKAGSFGHGRYTIQT